MTSSRIPVVTDALVTAWTGALPSTVQVRDGAVLQDVERAGLTIGANLDDSRWSWEQDWAGLGHVSRDEVFEIPCVLWLRTGDVEAVSATRTEVFGYFATLEANLRSNETLGLNGAWNVRCDIRPTAYNQPQTPNGIVCRIDFNVRVQTRI